MTDGQQVVRPPSKEELDMVVKYVRVHLFPKVKFFYNETKDLNMGGKIYLDFVNKISNEAMCKRRADGEVDWNFLAHLWNVATANKIQKRTMNLKRSGVYTVMQNKFADLCQLSVDKSGVMLALESMLDRLSNPKSYYVFYEFFYKAAVGEAAWKTCMRDTNEERIGNDNTEAFALLVLANNYTAWLSDEKQRHQTSLITEYEGTQDEFSNASIVDILLPNIEIGLNNITQDTDSEEPERNFLLRDASDEAYRRLKQDRKDRVVMNITANRQLCQDMKKCWEEAQKFDEKAGDEEGEESMTTNYGKERARKKRRVMKGMRKWTSGAEKGQSTFKGWSTTGHKAFEKFVIDIRNDKENGKYKPWERVIRALYHEREEKEMRASNKAQERFEIDTDVVWEL